MDFLFKSEGCPACFFAQKVLVERLKKLNKTGYVKIVDVKFDKNTRKYLTYIEGKECGEAPVSQVPSYYVGRSEELIEGSDNVMEFILNASWKDDNQLRDERTERKKSV